MSEIISKVKIKPKIQGEIQVAKVYPELETLVAKPSLKEQHFRPEKYGYSSVTVNAIKTENLNITPSLNKQSFDGVYKEVTVNPIEKNNLVVNPKNEQQTFSGVYTDVTVNEIEGDTLNITPTTQSQSYEGVYEKVNVNPITENTLNVTPKTSDQSFNGVYTKVTVSEVTSNIDKNIKPENIKKGENILGVEGNFEGGIDTSDATALPENILQGKTAYANNEKITGTMEEYDGSFSGGTSSGGTSEIETSFLSLIDNSMGGNVTKFPSNLTAIGNYAFHSKTNLGLTELPDEITSIGQYSFYGCTNLALNKLPSSLESISSYAFFKCSNLQIKNITENVESISSFAFSECTSLTEITCESNLDSIGNSAFSKCSNLAKFALPNVTKVTTLGTTVFSNTPIANDEGYIYVPDTLVDSFKSATNWSRYETQIKAISEMGV